MLDAIIGNSILDGLFGLSGGNTISFEGDLYLGLLTKLPNANGAAYEDGTYFAELSTPDYQRFKVNSTSRINKKYIMADAAYTEETADENGDMQISSTICNQAAIIFTETTVAETVVGFGLFRSSDKTNRTLLPFLWGEVAGEDGETAIYLDVEEVPIIREGGFSVEFM